MTGFAVEVVAVLRAAEGWSPANAIGALGLGAVALGLLAYAVLVTLRR